MTAPPSQDLAAAGPFDAGALLERIVSAPHDERRAILERAGGAVLLVALGDAAERRSGVNVSSAIHAAQALVEVADELAADDARGVDDRAGRARARRAHSQALAYGGRYEDALRSAAEAHDLARDIAPVEAARARLVSVHPLALLGRYEEALLAGEEALALLTAAGQRALAGRASLNLANVEKSRGDPHAALRRLDFAAEQLADEPEQLRLVENARGTALIVLDEFVAAEAAFERARHAFLQSGTLGESSFALAVVEGNLADLLARQGRLQEAMTHFEAARRALAQSGGDAHLPRVMIEQAEALESLGMPEEALALVDEAMPEIQRLGLKLEAARGNLARGRALLRVQRFDDADTALRRSAASSAELGDPVAESVVNVLLGELLVLRGRDEDAAGLLTAAAERLRQRPLTLASALHHLATIDLRRGDFALAGRRLEEAIEIATRLEVVTLLADCLEARGRLRRAAGDLAGAASDLRASIEHVESLRGSLQADRLRAAFLGRRLGAYQELVRVLIDRGGADAAATAFAVAERAKSRALLDLVRGSIELARAAGGAQSPQEISLRRELSRLLAEINVLYTQLGGATEADQRRVAEGVPQRGIAEREGRAQVIELRLADSAPRRAASDSAISDEDVRSLLEPNAALIEYFVAGDELVAWVLRPSSPTVLRRLGCALPEVESLVSRMQFQLARALRPGVLEGPRASLLERDLRAALHELWRTLVAPLERDLAGATRLVVVPHGVLHAVPFHALHDGRGWLIERHECSVAPSAGIWRHAQTSDRPKGAHGECTARMLVVGVADGLAPRIADEASRVAAILPGATLLCGADATAQRVRDELSGVALAHLACHGRFSPASPLHSGLRVHDRWLTVRDLAEVRLDSALVVLSGCDTGRGLLFGGDELLGLLRGFLAAGAATVLVSLWSASDTVTALLMERFYGEARGGSRASANSRRGLEPPSIGAALRAAQLALLRTHPHPAHWAPFVLVGRS